MLDRPDHSRQRSAGFALLGWISPQEFLEDEKLAFVEEHEVVRAKANNAAPGHWEEGPPQTSEERQAGRKFACQELAGMARVLQRTQSEWYARRLALLAGRWLAGLLQGSGELN